MTMGILQLVARNFRIWLVGSVVAGTLYTTQGCDDGFDSCVTTLTCPPPPTTGGVSGAAGASRGMPPGVGGTTGMLVGGAEACAGAGGCISSAPEGTGTIGEPCSPNGVLACAGLAAKGQLVCASGRWSLAGLCTAGFNCDTSTSNRGACAPVVPACENKMAGSLVCGDGQSVTSCGPDLVTTRAVSTCTNQACVNGACVGECAPGVKQCTENGLKTCGATGLFEAAVPCVNQACSGNACVGVCTPGTKRCSGNSVETCDGSGQYGIAVACAAGVPVCQGAGVCGLPPSCSPGQPSCPGGRNCCSSTVVPGGTFDLAPNNPRTVSAFRLDDYEVTVLRFRSFLDAYDPTKVLPGSGKNPNNTLDPGWDASWNARLFASAAEIKTTMNTVNPGRQTWTDTAAYSNKPINLVTWYEAQAFCIWDGGRLPTEAEWAYASTGGTARAYPWGETDPGASAVLAVHNCYYGSLGGSCSSSYSADNIAPVGSAQAGAGPWGHLDLAGNIAEWVQDRYRDTPTLPGMLKIDWADLADPTVQDAAREALGGNFKDYASSLANTAARTTFQYFSMTRLPKVGFRCARAR
ncbi:MAG: formylglycine-generating enzyme family protein [Polyangiaceae bacterium]|nr:formylglycine-generating enzyme family protein [Polyangiaceae bacterium]